EDVSPLAVRVSDIAAGPISSDPSYLANVNGTLFFSAYGANGKELWKSDGTPHGTVGVRNIAPDPAGSDPSNLTRVKGVNGATDTLYFSADDGANGRELWKSDGTNSGTVMVADVAQGSPSSIPQDLTDVNGTLFFSADDGTHGTELWKSDGSPSG